MTVQTAEPDLPDSLVLIDGMCVLCSASFRFVARRDQHRRFRFAPIQGAVGRRVARAIGINPDQPDTFAVILDGRPFFKSEGAIAILQRLPGWRWTSILLMVPAPFRKWLYDRVARNRYRLFGRLDMCIVPTAELQAHMYHEVP